MPDTGAQLEDVGLRGSALVRPNAKWLSEGYLIFVCVRANHLARGLLV